MTCKDHSVSAYLRVECESLEARRVAAGVTATLRCNPAVASSRLVFGWAHGRRLCASVSQLAMCARRIHSATIVPLRVIATIVYMTS